MTVWKRESLGLNNGLGMEDNFTQLNQKLDFLLVHMDEKFDAVDKRFDETVDQLATAVKQGFDAFDDRFDAMDTRFDTLEKTVDDIAVATKLSFDAIDDRFDDADDRFVELRTEMRDGFAQMTERSKRLDTDVTACTRRINRIESVVGI